LPRANSRASESSASFECKFTRAFVSRRELNDVRVGLLEVIADDLVRSVSAVQCSPGTLVKVGTLGFGNPSVRDVTYEDVVETQDALGRVNEGSLRELIKLVFSCGCLLVWGQVV
jgi:hypothetical protein